MDFEFDDLEIDRKSNERKSQTFQQILDHAHNNSIDWDKFDVVDNHSDSKNSDISNIFDKQKSRSYEVINREDINQSRNILEISYNKEKQGKSFRFQTNVQNVHHQQNSRYQRLKYLLTKAKHNSLSAFYQNMDKINQQSQPQHHFHSKQQFRDYIKQIKENKKKAENKFKNEVLKNNNKIQLDKNYKLGKQSNFNQQNNYDFFKKQPSNVLLPQKFLNQNYDDIEEQIVKPKTKQYDGQKQARQFLESSRPIMNKKLSKKNSQKQLSPLDTIRQQKPTFFQKTIQQQKLCLLINNYQDMRSNFDNLMTQLKQANQGQQQIVSEFKKIKQQLNKKDRQQEKERKRILRNKSNQIKKQQFQQIKEEINKIKQQSNKDLLFMKINQKIQTLQSAVKTALGQISQEKQQPFVPKIVNYFCEGQIESKPLSSVALSEQSMERYKKEKQQVSVNKFNRAYIEQPNFSRSNLISPFELANVQPQEYFIDRDIQFKPEEFAQKYYPKKIDINNRNMRKSLTQKNSLIYQSFEFHVSAKFTLLDDDVHPLMAQIRVGNKCLISLSDVFVIVYGAQGSGPITKPSNIYYDTFKQDTSFTFEVFLNKQCLDDNGFHIQISYKSDILAKKKVNIKVPIPILRLIRPQFIYQQQFCQAWNHLNNQIFIAPRTLDFMHIRSHQDIKLILPFTHISQGDPNVFSYGIMFKYPKCQSLFLMKLYCFINGKASVHLRTDKLTDSKIKEELLDVMNFLLFSP